MTENQNTQDQPKKSNRGFAAMSPERQRQIASEGGRAAHRQGVAHEWSSQEAKEAGRKGGQARGNRGRSQENNSSDNVL